MSIALVTSDAKKNVLLLGTHRPFPIAMQYQKKKETNKKRKKTMEIYCQTTITNPDRADKETATIPKVQRYKMCLRKC